MTEADYIDDQDLEDDDEDSEDVEDESSDNVGDPSVEINVEELINELESAGLSSKLDQEQDARRRLEELMERRRASRDLEDFEDYDI